MKPNYSDGLRGLAFVIALTLMLAGLSYCTINFHRHYRWQEFTAPGVVVDRDHSPAHLSYEPAMTYEGRMEMRLSTEPARWWLVVTCPNGEQREYVSLDRWALHPIGSAWTCKWYEVLPRESTDGLTPE
jgi:hypothetical protein